MVDKDTNVPVIWLCETLSGAGLELAGSFDVRAVAAAALPGFFADGTSCCHVVARGAPALHALEVVLARATQIETLTLIAPPALSGLDAEMVRKLGTFDVHTLALFGSRASAPEATTPWRRAMPKCHLNIVYDCEARPDDERPQAVAAIMGEFFRRKDGFLVRVDDGRLHP